MANLHEMNLAVTLLGLLFHFVDASRLPAAQPFSYAADPTFFRFPERIQLEACSAAAVDGQGNIYLLHRGKHPVICLDKRGQFLRAWGDGAIAGPHGLRVDPAGNLWVTDVAQHVVLKFTAVGEQLLVLGRAGIAGSGSDEFNKPTDVAFSATGEVYVSDGYVNSRVKKYAADGRLLKMWGEPGSGAGQLNVPHAIITDSTGRIVVGDSGNQRVQVFDSQGKLLEMWHGFTALGLAYDAQGNLFVADGLAHRVLQLNDKGRVIGSWGSEGTQPGQFQTPHMLAADAQGNLYVGEVKGKRFQKLERQP